MNVINFCGQKYVLEKKAEKTDDKEMTVKGITYKLGMKVIRAPKVWGKLDKEKGWKWKIVSFGKGATNSGKPTLVGYIVAIGQRDWSPSPYILGVEIFPAK